MGRCDIYNRSEILFGKFFIMSLCMSWHLTAIFLLVVLLVWYLVNQGSNSKTAFCLFWSFLLRKDMTKKVSNHGTFSCFKDKKLPHNTNIMI